MNIYIFCFFFLVGDGVEGLGWGYDETVDNFRGLSQNWTIFGSYF